MTAHSQPLPSTTPRIPASQIRKTFERISFDPDPANALAEDWQDLARNSMDLYREAMTQSLKGLMRQVKKQRALSEPEEQGLTAQCMDYATTRFVQSYYQDVLKGKIKTEIADSPTAGLDENRHSMRTRLIEDAMASAAEQAELIHKSELLKVGEQSMGKSFMERLDRLCDAAFRDATPDISGR